MRNLSLVALFFLLITGFSSGQQIIQAVTDLQTDTQPAPVKVYAIGSGVTTPEFLPLDLGPFPTEKCRQKADGKVVLSLLVDETGQPRNIMFLHPLGTDLDRFALKLVGADRFNPGKYNGTPVVVGQSVEVSMETCVVQTKDEKASISFRLLLRSQPVQKFGELPQPPEEAVLVPNGIAQEKSERATPIQYKVGGKVSAPVVLNNIEAEFTDAARRAKYQGKCLISFIVDRNGLPQDLRVVRPLDYGLTEESIVAVKKYRFKPAMKNGEPVPVKITIEVNFRLG